MEAHMLPWLHPSILAFPHPENALDDPNGLLAAGGDLSIERLLLAYRNGIFPWYSHDEPILWWSPNPRCVIFPDQTHISKSLKKHIKRHPEWSIHFDTCFDQVIQNCADTRKETGTWISDDIIFAYTQLHKAGIAHSIEVFNGDNRLIGGLYGLAIGKLFFGESMFSLETNASKVAFAGLNRQLSRWGFPLVDCQVENDHLLSLGATSISRDEFLNYIDSYIDKPNDHPWRFDPDILQ
jgi:leucyl/phenylalanyl-tRNA--protein transferase